MTDGRTRPQRQAARSTIRETNIRDDSNVVIGRDGERLSRTRTGGTDPFGVPPELIEPGWDMQWIAHTVVGSKEAAAEHHLQMLANGWRPVMANRPGFDGRFMPVGYTGHIVRGG